MKGNKQGLWKHMRVRDSISKKYRKGHMDWNKKDNEMETIKKKVVIIPSWGVFRVYLVKGNKAEHWSRVSVELTTNNGEKQELEFRKEMFGRLILETSTIPEVNSYDQLLHLLKLMADTMGKWIEEE